MKPKTASRSLCAMVLALAMCAPSAPAGAAEERSSEALSLSLEDLLKTEITTVSRKSQTLYSTAAAVFVITREDIERSGVTHIADALQMAPGVEVARISNNHWAVSVRGFNGRMANKLLVLIDGRSVYSPLFSGVIWELEDTLLEDVDRIEVIRGPGAAMWGANAVNGVINIITRKTRETQGNLLVAGGGTEGRVFGEFRHGGKVGDGHYRVWGKAGTRDGSVNIVGERGNDFLRARRAGFRGDWPLSSGNRLMVTGEVFHSPSGDRWDIPDPAAPQGSATTDIAQVGRGGHLLGRHDWIFKDGSEAGLQSYLAFSDLKLGDILRERRTTLDVDFQHRLRLGARHDVIWGLGYRRSSDRIDSQGMIQLTPGKRDFNLFSAFVHDEISLLPDRLSLILGARVERNSYTGWEPQPNVRMIWTPTPEDTVWGAVSHAVRTPSRAELDGQVDLYVQPAVPPFQPAVLTRNLPTAEDNLVSEQVTAFELGYRHQFGARLSLDLAVFRNRYDDLRAAALGRQEFVFAPVPYVVQTFTPNNGVEARTHGLEIALEWHPTSWWRIQPSYTYLSLKSTSKTADPIETATAAAFEGSSARHRLSLRSSMSLPRRQQIDVWLRRVGALENAFEPGKRVAGYTTADLRYAWRPMSGLELSVIGRDLLERRHAEFFADYLPTQLMLVERSVYAKVRWQF